MPRPRTRQRIACPHCGAETVNKRYCSNSCQQAYLRNALCQRWIAGDLSDIVSEAGYLRRSGRIAVLHYYGFACSSCGWNKVHPVSGISPVQVDHIDGDPINNRFENLCVLCPNCHALTETYGARNKASARAKRGLPDFGRASSRPDRVPSSQRI